MKIAICDDDKAVTGQLHRLIQAYAVRHMYDYTILEFDRCETLLQAARRDPDIQIMFLDIYMESMSGMDLAETLRMEGNNCSIIFVTISTDHYARSYEVNAEHYLVKPITYEQVEKALARCGQRLTAAASYAAFTTGGQNIRVPLRQIRYAEVFRNQTIIHASSDISLRSTLETVIRQLSDPRFLRTHRSFLLNMDYIDYRDGSDILLKTGERIPLSRACEKKFERTYGQFLTEAMAGGII